MIVDSHHHFWDPSRRDYPWMGDELAAIRRRFEERFTSARMAKDYVRLYRKLIAKRGREKALNGTRLQPDYRPGDLEPALHAD